MSNPTTKEIAEALKKLGYTADLRTEPIKCTWGEYRAWRCDLHRKRSAYTGWGTTPGTAMWGAVMDVIRRAAK